MNESNIYTCSACMYTFRRSRSRSFVLTAGRRKSGPLPTRSAASIWQTRSLLMTRILKANLGCSLA